MNFRCFHAFTAWAKFYFGTRALCFIGFSLSVSVFCMSAWAHDDLDLGIESVALNKNCKVQIVVKNYGHDLPDSFYNTVTPAFIQIKKGSLKEKSRSLRALDRKRSLQPVGGTLTVISKKTFGNIPDAIYLSTHYAEEFGDYGAGNNFKVKAMDCKPGVGQIPGAPIVYTQPDVAITDARIDPLSCKISIQLTNLTKIKLDEGSWGLEQGVSIMQLDLDTQQRAADIPLVKVDPDKSFGRVTQVLEWEGELPFQQATKMRIGLWRVMDDLDFSNNNIDLAVPNNCSEVKVQ